MASVLTKLIFDSVLLESLVRKQAVLPRTMNPRRAGVLALQNLPLKSVWSQLKWNETPFNCNKCFDWLVWVRPWNKVIPKMLSILPIEEEWCSRHSAAGFFVILWYNFSLITEVSLVHGVSRLPRKLLFSVLMAEAGQSGVGEEGLLSAGQPGQKEPKFYSHVIRPRLRD